MSLPCNAMRHQCGVKEERKDKRQRKGSREMGLVLPAVTDTSTRCNMKQNDPTTCLDHTEEQLISQASCHFILMET